MANTHTPTALGIDIGGTSIKFGAVGEDGTIIEQTALPTDADRGPDAVFERIASGIRPLLEKHAGTVQAIGLGVPGTVNDRGEISYPPNFPGWEVIAVADRLRPLLGTKLPIAVENDANVAAFAEARAGSGSNDDDFLYITLGTGVGGCVIVDGQIWRGATGGAGEVGHLSVDLNGPVCNCGARGCVEVYLGQRHITSLATARLQRFPESRLHTMIGSGEELSPRLINDAAEAGDQFAQDLFAEVGNILGAALASAMNVCDLRLVIVGGGLSKADRFLLEPARRSIRSRVLKGIARDFELRVATFGNDAGMIGAGLLALEDAKNKEQGTKSNVGD